MVSMSLGRTTILHFENKSEKCDYNYFKNILELARQTNWIVSIKRDIGR